jgi:hypothetical protein
MNQKQKLQPLNQFGEFRFSFPESRPWNFSPVLSEMDTDIRLAVPRKIARGIQRPLTTYSFYGTSELPHGKFVYELDTVIRLCDPAKEKWVVTSSGELDYLYWGTPHFSRIDLEALLSDINAIHFDLKSFIRVSLAIRSGMIQEHYWLPPRSAELLQNVLPLINMYRNVLRHGIELYPRVAAYKAAEQVADYSLEIDKSSLWDEL